MLFIYYVNIVDSNFSIEERVKRKISPKKIEAMDNFFYPIDKKRGLYGEALIRYSLIRHFHFENNAINFGTNIFGKPFVNDSRNIHFNISHSGNIVICAISSEKVGIDIELIKNDNKDIARAFFCEEEYSHIESQLISNSRRLFYNYWTLKESYVKYIGKGLSIPLKDFCIRISETNELVFLEKKYMQYNPSLKLLNIDSQYSSAISFDAKSIDCITPLSPSEIEIMLS